MKLLIVDSCFSLPADYTLEQFFQVHYIRRVEDVQAYLYHEVADLCLLSDSFLDLLPALAPQIVTAILGHRNRMADVLDSIRLGAVDYLPLPANTQTVAALLDRMQNRLRDDSRHQHKLWLQNRPIVHEYFWKQLLEGNIPPNESDIYDSAARYDVDIRGFFQPIYFRVRERTPHWKLSQEQVLALQQESLNTRVQKLIRSTFTEFPQLQSIKVSLHVYLLIVPYRDTARPYDTLQSCAHNLIAQCQSCGLDTVLHLGTPTDIFHLTAHVDQMMFTGQSLVYLDNQVVPAMVSPPKVANPPQPNLDRVMTLLDSGMYGKALDTIKDFFYNPKVMPVVNSSFLENYKFQFLDSLRNLSLARRGDVNILQGLPAQAVSEGARTVNDFIDLAESVCEQLEQLNQAVPDSMPKSMVEIVKSHIMDRLAQNLSRNSIAEYFYLSPDYLDRIFKKALGQTVTDYIFVQRILLSQQLLTGSCLSVSEIASKAGFPSLSHFSNAFKRYTGCSPLAYRKKQAAKG